MRVSGGIVITRRRFLATSWVIPCFLEADHSRTWKLPKFHASGNVCKYLVIAIFCHFPLHWQLLWSNLEWAVWNACRAFLMQFQRGYRNNRLDHDSAILWSLLWVCCDEVMVAERQIETLSLKRYTVSFSPISPFFFFIFIFFSCLLLLSVCSNHRVYSPIYSTF